MERRFRPGVEKEHPPALQGLRLGVLVQDLAVDARRQIAYVATDQGLTVYHFGQETWEAYHQRDGLAQENITALALDRQGRLWGCQEMVQGGRRFRVRERITASPPGTGGDPGAAWTDVSSWYWAALLGRSPGPWWAVTVAEPLD